jgi:hypothetical protein
MMDFLNWLSNLSIRGGLLVFIVTIAILGSIYDLIMRAIAAWEKKK